MLFSIIKINVPYYNNTLIYKKVWGITKNNFFVYLYKFYSRIKDKKYKRRMQQINHNSQGF